MYLKALLADIFKVHWIFFSFAEKEFVANTQDLITDSHLDVIET